MIFTLLLFGCKSKKAVMTVSNVPDEKAKLEQEAALKKLQALEDEAKRKEAEEKARRDAEAAKAAASGYFRYLFTSRAVCFARDCTQSRG